jgi:membrane-bound ClpP family serine protease
LNSLVGATRGVRATLAPLGQLKVKGELWKARTEGGELLRDEPVEVLGTEGLNLVVRGLAEPGTYPEGK